MFVHFRLLRVAHRSDSRSFSSGFTRRPRSAAAPAVSLAHVARLSPGPPVLAVFVHQPRVRVRPMASGDVVDAGKIYFASLGASVSPMPYRLVCGFGDAGRMSKDWRFSFASAHDHAR